MSSSPPEMTRVWFDVRLLIGVVPALYVIGELVATLMTTSWAAVGTTPVLQLDPMLQFPPFGLIHVTMVEEGPPGSRITPSAARSASPRWPSIRCNVSVLPLRTAPVPPARSNSYQCGGVAPLSEPYL